MRPLDNKTAIELCRVLKQGTVECPPYAVKYKGSLIVTNQSWLLEWPIELVDAHCPRVSKLLDNQKHKKAISAERLRKKHWVFALLDDTGKYVEVTEDEPPEDGTFLMRYRNESIYYDWTNFEATEIFVPNAEYKLYRQPRHQDMADILRLLVVYDGERRVGVFANNTRRKHADSPPDPEEWREQCHSQQ